MEDSTAQPRWGGLVWDVVVAGAVGLALVLIARPGGSADLVTRQGWSAYLWWGLGLGALVGLVFRSRPARSALLPFAALAGLAVWTAASLRWTESDELTLTEVARTVTYLGVLIAVVGCIPPSRWRAGIAGAAAAGVVICASAMITRLWPGDLRDVVDVFEGDARRLSAPFGYWNAVGAWSGMTIALCLGWASHARSLAWRGLAAAAIPLCVAVSYMTYSRAAVAGTALGLAVVIAIARNRATLAVVIAAAAAGSVGVIAVIRSKPDIADATGAAGRPGVLLALAGAMALATVATVISSALGADGLRLSRRVTRVAVPAGAVLALVCIAAGAVAFGPDLWDQFKTTNKVEAADPAARLGDVTGPRYDHWKVAWESFEDAPWKGSGAGTFEYTWNQRADYGFVRDAHSLYLEALSELGIPGLALILAFISGIALAAWRAIALLGSHPDRGVLAGGLGAISAFLLGAGVDWLWESPAVTVLAMVLVGLVVLTSARPSKPPSWPLRIGLFIGALVCLAIQLPGLVATSEIRKSQQALRTRDVTEAREHADNAIDAQPWASSPLVQRSLVDERAGAYDAAIAELRAAADRAPMDWRIQLILARVEARRGNAEAALAALAEAKRLRPASQFFRDQ